MKSNLVRFGVLLAALAAPALRAAPAPVSVAVFAFQGDATVEPAYGNALANLVMADLRLLEPLRPVGTGPETGGLAFDDTPDASAAAELGRRLGAQALVTGRVLRSGQQLILTAKVVDPATGAALGTSLEGPADATITALAAELSLRLGGAILHESPAAAHARWPRATIRGSDWPVSLDHGLFRTERLAFVAAIDGVPIKRAKSKWGEPHAVTPGRHRITADYVDGSAGAQYEFYCDFLPNAPYGLHVNEAADRAQLWVTRPGVEHVPLLAQPNNGTGLAAAARLDQPISKPVEHEIVDTRLLRD